MPYANREDALKYNREYYQKNREKYREQGLERYKNKKPELRAYYKEYYAKNKDKVIARQLENYHKNNAEMRIRRAKWREKNKGRIQNDYLQRRYGITTEEREAIFQKQGGCCRLCGATENNDSRGVQLHVDHCHKTGKVRGILCNECNMMLGFAKDNVTILEAAIEYLKEERA